MNAGPASETLRCANHPNVETLLRCNRCGKPICPKCAVRTPVGFRCKECVNQQQAIFYSAGRSDYFLAAGIALVAGVLGGAALPFLIGLIPFFSWFIMLLVAPALAGAVAELIRRATGRRRGRYLGWLALAAVVAGGLLGFFASGMFIPLSRLLINFAIYIVMTVATLYARLR